MIQHYGNTLWYFNNSIKTTSPQLIKNIIHIKALKGMDFVYKMKLLEEDFETNDDILVQDHIQNSDHSKS